MEIDVGAGGVEPVATGAERVERLPRGPSRRAIEKHDGKPRITRSDSSKTRASSAPPSRACAAQNVIDGTSSRGLLKSLRGAIAIFNAGVYVFE